MADASIDRLIEALAAKLPAKATRQTVELALRAAIDAVPKSQLRDKLLLKEGRWVRAILQRLAERIENEVQDSAAAAEQEVAAEEEVAEEVRGQFLGSSSTLIQSKLRVSVVCTIAIASDVGPKDDK
ncbi:unnamed protein product [Symbiodinium sp. CCMP2592]|nr:unnamed protein product [Symbiodinium sp. CCMP2592]